MMLFDGELGNMQLFDLTNYPYQDFAQPRPYEMFGVSDECGSLLKLSYIGFYPDHYENRENGIGSKINIEISSMKIVHM